MRSFMPRLRTKPSIRLARLTVTRLETRCLPASFIAVNSFDESNAGDSSIPPDTTGAVGPNNFMEVINSAVAIYNKSTGARVSYTTLDAFFMFTANGTTFPRGGAYDPHVQYDQHSGHWFASALEFGNNQVDNDIMLAVSRTTDPTGLWNLFDIPVGVAANSSFTDFDTLGIDDNGVYFGMTIFPGSANSYAKIAATPKAPLIAASPSLGAVTQFSNITDMYSSPQPAFNFDAVGPTGPAFFVASSTTVFGNVNYRTLTWSGGTPSLSTTKVLSTPAYGDEPPNAPAMGSTTAVDTGDDRLLTAVIRNQHLWTARNVGVDASGGDSNASRAGIDWMELNATTTTLSLVEDGRIFDSAASNPRFYYYPSITVTGQGDMRIGFSGSKSTEFIGAYSAGRLVGDPAGTTTAPVQFKAGERAYTIDDNSGSNRWGDYSYTSTDPSDNMTAWTIQEYSSNVQPGVDNWGTWVQTLPAPAPTLNNPAGSGTQGQTGVTVNLTGTGFYNPGAAFPNSLQVQLTGGTINGISNVVTTYNSPTSATVTFNIAANASTGPRNIVLTNPDGQAITVIGGFTVNAAAIPVTVGSVVINDGSVQRSEVRSLTITFSGAVTFAGGAANAAAAFQLQHVQDTTNVANLAAAVSTNGSGQTVVVLTFTTNGNLSTEIDPVSAENGGAASLADGRFQLTIFGGSVTGTANGLALDGAGTGTPGSNYVSPTDTQGGGPGQLHLYRLFADLSGDGLDDQIDLGTFRNANNTIAGDPNYVALLDADNSGKIDQIDLGEFRMRNNTSVF
jgi:hypothetical protein